MLDFFGICWETGVLCAVLICCSQSNSSASSADRHCWRRLSSKRWWVNITITRFSVTFAVASTCTCWSLQFAVRYHLCALNRIRLINLLFPPHMSPLYRASHHSHWQGRTHRPAHETAGDPSPQWLAPLWEPHMLQNCPRDSPLRWFRLD